MAKYISNREIAKLFREISAGYEAKGENRFKVIAYDNAAASVDNATRELIDLWENNQLDTVPGLGSTIRQHLDELFRTGKVKHFEQIKNDLPIGMFQLLNIGGLGPKTAYKLANELNIKNITDLEIAARKKKIRTIAGFGEKSENEILTAIAELKGKTGGRYLLTEVFPVAERIIQHLKKHKDCERADTLGSLRRMVATVGDIDIAVASANPKGIIEHFKTFKEIKRVIDAGSRKSSVLLYNGMQVDLIVQPTRAFGALLQHFTGSKNHNIHLREYALKKSLSVSDYGIKEKGKVREFTTEEEFYKFLGMDYVVPELRENMGEIEAALNHQLPNVINLSDIKGDLHLHSNYPIEPSHDLVTASIEQILQKAIDLNYEYIGLSDHSPGFSTHTKKEMINLIKRRSGVIEQIKSSQPNIKILNLLEIDILTNGELSVPNEGLSLLNGSIAGIHSSHKQDKNAITKRLMNAINSPYVQIISHPTGRLINKRASYEANWPVIFKACVRTNTMLEVNAYPNRLDLTDMLIREAISAGVKLVINTDSHDLLQMENMRFGVATARRGWAQKKDIANALSWLELRRLFRVS